MRSLLLTFRLIEFPVRRKNIVSVRIAIATDEAMESFLFLSLLLINSVHINLGEEIFCENGHLMDPQVNNYGLILTQ